MGKRRGKKGEILVENIIFIVLNIAFLAILVIFLVNQGNGATFLEDSYSKQVALLIDSARPGMIIHINFESAKVVSDKNGIPFSEILIINGQYATIRLSEESGKSYHFFNNINIDRADPDKDTNGEYTGFYTLVFSNKNDE
ncbi:MAG: hypothetical protein Q8Q04_00430 [archaeon]|nr:hypothetical protein [archaeon]